MELLQQVFLLIRLNAIWLCDNIQTGLCQKWRSYQSKLNLTRHTHVIL